MSACSGFRNKSILFVDDRAICGNMAQFYWDVQYDVGLVIQPGVWEAAES
jgi:hypothetical protein